MFCMARSSRSSSSASIENLAPEIRPVRVVTVESAGGGDSVSLTGRIQAESEVNLAFRIDGRMISRAVNVGDTVAPGQEIARLNPENEENGLRAAEATLQGARGQLIEARANEERNRSLLAQNFISPAAFDRITQVANSAQAQVDAAQAQVSIARNRLGYTRLLADAGGVGGPFGFSEEVYQRANFKVSLSAMTFSHQMIRLLFVEQLYRAFTIIRGEKYHHE